MPQVGTGLVSIRFHVAFITLLSSQLTPTSISKLLSLAVPLRLDADMYYYHLVRRLTRTVARLAREAASADSLNGLSLE